MKRMTTRVYGKSSLVKGMSIFDIKEAVDRLAAIEDILGDEYDLDRLRELAEADREGRRVVLPRLEPGQGDDPGPPGVPGPPGRHMTKDKLIRWLRTASGSIGGVKMSRAAADALAELQAENAYMRERRCQRGPLGTKTAKNKIKLTRKDRE